jgi:beta-lactamase class A
MKTIDKRNTWRTIAILVGIAGIAVLLQDHGRPASAAVWLPDTVQDVSNPPSKTKESLPEQLAEISKRAAGDVGIAVIHVETGQTVAIQATKALPLYSVFKLPLAIAVLKEVEEKRLKLDQTVKVTPEDVAPGSVANADLWHKPVDRTVAQLIEVSIIRSDNTSTDKLLELIGGPAGLTKRMHAIGYSDIEIVSTTRQFSAARNRPNVGTAEHLARLLAQLQKGELLQPPHQALLLDFMRRATTGLKRLRGNLPRGTTVADKTGTGEVGTVTNDVGIITLPGGRGHLAIAVLISGSKLGLEAQEKLIAQIARAAYDAYVVQS